MNETEYKKFVRELEADPGRKVSHGQHELMAAMQAMQRQGG